MDRDKTIRSIFSKYANDGRELSDNFDFQEIKINSLNFIKIVVEIEDAFDIEFSDEELNFDIFNNLNDITTLITEKTRERSRV